MKAMTVLLMILFTEVALACPMCAGSALNEGDQYTIYILGGFILLTYIPFFLLYRMVIKNRNLNKKGLPMLDESNPT